MASKKILAFPLLFAALFCFSQNQQDIYDRVEHIKNNPSVYLWGEGRGITLEKAKKEAFADLVNQISITVESNFDWKREENQNGFQEDLVSVINTYSNTTTLKNTRRIIISDAPNAKVFTYMRRSELDTIFLQRKKKIYSFVSDGKKAEEENRIGDALRYYCWSMALLRSHPDFNEITIANTDGNSKLLFSWIHAKMNEIFSKITFQVKDIIAEENSKTVLLAIKHNNKAVLNIDYDYWDGRGYSSLISAKNGLGYLEFGSINAFDKNHVKIRVEYKYENQANYDPDIKAAMKYIENDTTLIFPARNYHVYLKNTGNKDINAAKTWNKITKVANSEEFNHIISNIIKAIKEKNYDDVKNYFTPGGYTMFTKLINYGNAKVVGYFPETAVYKINNKYTYRSLHISFRFEKNYKEFIEDVIFHFDENKKIESLSFGLSEAALQSIMSNNTWPEVDRLLLINFLEHFKTAYALERINYIDSIFADDALIIVGYVVKVKEGVETRFKDNKIVKLNKYDKETYLKHLRNCFETKEYINITFEESTVQRGGAGGNIYGVQIKQNYYSSNYGDKGYLFLVVDLNDPIKPTIHVRTWQPNKWNDGTLYDLSHF